MKRIFLLLLPAMVFCSCHSNRQDDEAAIAVTLKGDTIQIGANSPILSRLKTEKVTSEPYSMEFSTSGVVKAIPANYAEIASPFAGRISKSFVRLGQKVVPGSLYLRSVPRHSLKREKTITRPSRKWNWR
nr:hypothetical protein [Parabacteroides sp. AF48-14]